MQWWIKYKRLVESNTLAKADPEIRGLAYWRDRLFTNILLYLLPVSLVALVPGVVMSVKDNVPLLAVYDIFIAIVIGVITFNRSFSLAARKTLIVICLYLLSVILLVYLGALGPGLLYLFGLTIFITLIFSVSVAWLSIAINTVIVIISALIIYFKHPGTALPQLYSLGPWIAVSSNLLFLSVVVVASLNLLFNGLEASILKANRLQNELREESKSLERALSLMETKNRELEQFAYIASHDLQEPLKTISNVVNIFEDQYKGRLDNDAVTYLSFLSLSAERMRLLITGLLDYARIGKEGEMELVNSQVLLQELISDLDMLITESRANIFIGKMPALPAYRLELKQLFQNLISNAIKFRQPGGQVEVRICAQEENDCWTFSVKDNGIGIGEKFHKKIFMIFKRLHARSKYEGSGIGLSHCKKIVELHHGKIWVESVANEGSTFYFTIPKNAGVNAK